ncbi:MarR family transcriptional regulator [Novosphingobium sp. RD2P27]|uniref:MarR family transcriptional regulator n=1 Tax=Novosphingobium kalidii TaxID=3230299 RepID=A0ABV2D392_9SPHN
MPSERLERFAAELVALAEQMRQESNIAFSADDERELMRADCRVPGLPATRAQTLARWCELATRLYRFRRQRDRLFGSIFGEPGWDILLDLFIMEAAGKRVPVSSACLASGVSHSTALRQIDEMVRYGLVFRERDEVDKRRTYVWLTDTGLARMGAALEQLSSRGDGDGQEAWDSPLRERLTR